ncbi:GMP/IMP nucleotidase [Pasteurellaceae bacterium HPA106]|uniref:GMP/IMP nucleotidase n=1 Tax=Spirabiliibacterium pneumoniae TaxID=221400 RepID=UPI001AAD69E0|nr:GMP/IMP nucleotidase [Spirabiliibacterium pneumoniae]MBE2897076.1 GMP/IMP nucleotidase [Spirabiliibacterium pneumoniae]
MLKNCDWAAIDTVIFDLDGTLIDLALDYTFWKSVVPQAYSATHAVPDAASQQLLKAHYDRIEHAMQWYDVDYWADTLQLPIREMLHQHVQKLKVRSNTEKLLSTLKRMGKQLILLTDSHPYSLQEKLAQCNLEPYFELILSSHEFQHPKMTDALWQALFSAYAITPDRTLLIDDMQQVLDCARANGIGHTLAVRTPNSLTEEKHFIGHDSIADFAQLLN